MGSLVLLPGLDGTGRLFQPLCEALPPWLKKVVVAYPAREPLSYAALLPRVMAALPVGSPFVIVAESFSGPLGLWAAAQRPAGLRGLVLSASFFRCPQPLAPRGVRHLIHPAMLRVMPRISQVKALLGCYTSRELAGLVHETLAMVSPEVFACRLREVLAVDASTAVAACPVPLLYLQGADDWVVPGCNARAIQQLNPAATIHTLPAAHLVLQSQPLLAATALVGFLTTTCGLTSEARPVI